MGKNMSWSNHWCCPGPSVELTQGESKCEESCAWALSLASPCRCHQTPALTPALTKEVNPAWLPSCSSALWITQSIPPARLRPGCCPGYDASGVQVSWGRDIPTPRCSHGSPSFSFPPGGSCRGQELHRQCLMFFTGLPWWRGVSLLTFSAAWRVHKAQPSLSHHRDSALDSFKMHPCPTAWASWEGTLSALFWTVAVGKDKKDRASHPQPASSASFTSLCEAEQKEVLLQCASISDYQSSIFCYQFIPGSHVKVYLWLYFVIITFFCIQSHQIVLGEQMF